MKIPKTFKKIGDKKPCHTIGVLYDGDIQIVIYKQWVPWKKYWLYYAVERGDLYDELYYKRYKRFPKQ